MIYSIKPVLTNGHSAKRVRHAGVTCGLRRQAQDKQRRLVRRMCLAACTRSDFEVTSTARSPQGLAGQCISQVYVGRGGVICDLNNLSSQDSQIASLNSLNRYSLMLPTSFAHIAHVRLIDRFSALRITNIR